MEIICDRAGVSIQNQSLTNLSPDLLSVLTYQNRAIKPQDAMTATGAAYCVNVIANDVGRLPLCLLYLNVDNQIEEDLKHPGGKVMRISQQGLTQFQLRRSIQLDALLYGNGRAFIVRNGRGEPSSLIPLPADRTATVIVQERPIDVPEKYHVVFYEDGIKHEVLNDTDVLHVYTAGTEKYQGDKPYQMFGTALGLAIDGEKFAQNFFRNNGTPSVVLQAPVGAFRKPEDAQDFLSRFNDHHSGPHNAGKAALLREGVTAEVLGSALRDNQLIEQREFQVREMMRAYGVHMVPGISDSQSYNTLEQHNRAYLDHGLDHWLKVWEQECDAKLLTEAERRQERYYFDFRTDSLTLPNGLDRANMNSTEIRGMIKTINEVRQERQLPPIEGGDVLFNPAITTQPNQQPEPEETEPKPDAQATARVRSWLVAESREVARMAGKARNFADWSSEFYGKHRKKFPGTEQQAEHVVDCHLAQLNDIAGACTPENFAATVAAAVKEWPSEAEQIAKDSANG